MYEIISINRSDSAFPQELVKHSVQSISTISVIGKPEILSRTALGLICSVQCHGNIILKTFDTIRVLRDAGIVMIGGFHSPMERDCLDILLNGRQPVILCAARSLKNLRIGAKARDALKDGRLLVISPFADNCRRTTSAHAVQRNDLVCAIAHSVLVPYASPNGKTWAAAKKAIESNKPVYTFDTDDNMELIRMGARPFNCFDVSEFLSNDSAE